MVGELQVIMELCCLNNAAVIFLSITKENDFKFDSFLGWVPVDLGPTSLDEIGSLLGTSKVLGL